MMDAIKQMIIAKELETDEETNPTPTISGQKKVSNVSRMLRAKLESILGRK